MAKSKTKTTTKNTKKRRPAHHAGWKGQLRCGLVTFGVQAFNTAVPERGEFHFHQLHDICHSRIYYQKVCPIHGEVALDEIVSGFEYQPGKYIEVEPDELESLRSAGERSLTIHEFISPDELDPMYYDGRMYCLLPDGEAAGEAYAVLQAAMKRQNKDGIGQALFSGRQQLVRVRAVGRVLMMALLHYAEQLKTPEEWEGELSRSRPAKKSVDLAVQLIQSFTSKDFDFGAYEDDYRQRVKELIDAKREGREPAVVAVEEAPATVNLMDALRKSLERGRRPAAQARRRKTPRKRTAASRRRRAS
jgi:DNA end-binding protein Ku